MNIIVAPSLLSADFSDLKSAVKMINESDAGWIHLDVMDGVFVPNISFGLPVIRAVKTLASKPLDVHLMIVNPDKYISDFRKAGADVLEDILHNVDLVCMMSVNPGFGGQKFIPHTLDKISSLHKMIKHKKLSTYIEADGGVDLQNYRAIVK